MCNCLLFFLVFAIENPLTIQLRRAFTRTRSGHPERVCRTCRHSDVIFASRMQFRDVSTFFPAIPCRINTRKNVTKQTTLTIFRINTYEKHRGSAPYSSEALSPIPHPRSSIPSLFTLFRTLLHFLALTQNSTLFFSSNSALFAQNTRVWVGGRPCHS